MSPPRTFFSALALLIACSVMARTGQVAERVEQLRGRGVDFERVELLRPVVDQDALWREALTKGGVVQIDRAMTSALIKSRQEHLSLVVPFEGSSLPLDLARTEVGPEDLRVVAASGAVSIGLPGIHYRGMVRGVPGSWAAISIFEGEVMGLINNGQGQIVLGKFDKDQRGLHVVIVIETCVVNPGSNAARPMMVVPTIAANCNRPVANERCVVCATTGK